MTYVPYHAYEGPTAPPSDLGRPGDTFLDTESSELYARQIGKWMEWRGPVPSKRTMASQLNETTWSEFRSLLIAHPDFPHADRLLWCDGHEMGWFGRPAISGKRKDMFEEMEFGLDDVGNGRAVVKRLLETRAKGGKRVHEDAPPTVKSHKKSRANTSKAQRADDIIHSATSVSTTRTLDVAPVDDMMKVFGKAMEHALGAQVQTQEGELKTAQVKIQALEQRISELQLKHVMELNRLQNQLADENEQRLLAETGLAREVKGHKKVQKRYDKLTANVQRMHSARSERPSHFTHLAVRAQHSLISIMVFHPYDTRREQYEMVAGGAAFVISGAVDLASHKNDSGPASQRVVAMSFESLPEVLTLFLSFLVTITTEAIGYVHGVTLRSALTEENRLHFNNKARLFTATRKRRITGPNGLYCNILTAALFILSTVSATCIFTKQSDDNALLVSLVPMITLGICLVVQALIAAYGLHTTRIITWDSTALGTTLALSRLRIIHHTKGRCMCNVTHLGSGPCPLKPSPSQPSAWQARRDVRVTMISMWILTGVCAGFGGIFMYNSSPYLGDIAPTGWTLIARPGSPSASVFLHNTEGQVWFSLFGLLSIIQGSLALALHQAGNVASALRDEQVWRETTSAKGSPLETSIIRAILSPPYLLLLASKPILHWMMSLANTVVIGLENPGELAWHYVYLNAYQYWNLSIAAAVLSAVFTVLVLLRPRGPQPAAYGHFQTLANLIDEWPDQGDEQSRLFWGHKGEYKEELDDDVKTVFHAGTSEKPLETVRIGETYA
ncbi:hypothetical protein CONPUDRAFT_143427 [Coniophora puteana RWD-64-598 SS2]|uniref:Uncharacterized protein n=1 Tax=Coniophora puteana (strain RWD-64-598) TaxID=741705 RepID=A0A5M3MRB1_CONPW|nr:uncharacterized protein CONPUDRAFT_143427 [Coniophora puteana RWD-64-598 SS2]EIW81699.1 hypothetical protein CONPUDRAFT_143427 [Coniophora puteana RWD-64-598 SS2]